MKYTKTLAVMFGAVLAVGSMFMAGCHDETKKLDKCLKFAKSAGTTVGYVINTSVSIVGPEVKDTVAAVTTAIVTELPTNVTVETIAVDLKTISTNAVQVAIPEIYEKYPELVNETVDTLLGFLQIGLESISKKYPTEFSNANMFYRITYAFLDNVHTIVVIPVNRELTGEVGRALAIVPVSYDDIAAAAKADGNKILSKHDFEALMAALVK